LLVALFVGVVCLFLCLFVLLVCLFVSLFSCSSFVFLCVYVFFFFFVHGGQVWFKMARLSVVLETQKAGIWLNCQGSFALRLACNTYSV